MTKDNIMKLTDGLFHRVFDEIAPEYPDLESEHWIIDIGIAKLADTPGNFDVVVVPNLYGDLVSDMTAQIAGSVGFAPSANIGDNHAMFEAIHGSAPRYAGQNLANPSGLLLSGVMLLVHIGQAEAATRIHNAWLKTLEDRVWTYDLVRKAKAAGLAGYTEVGTREFAKAVVSRLGQKPERLPAIDYRQAGFGFKPPQLTAVRNAAMQLDGVDIFLHEGQLSGAELGRKLEPLAGPEFRLVMITNRGQKVYPGGFSGTFCTDHWRCRFQAPDGGAPPTPAAIRQLLARLEQNNLQWIKLENLYLVNGKRGYSLGQGQ
jgi:isocitrate dehydrogenase